MQPSPVAPSRAAQDRRPVRSLYKETMRLLEFPKGASVVRVLTAKEEADVRRLPAWDLSPLVGATAPTMILAPSSMPFNTATFDSFVNAALVPRLETALRPAGAFYASLALVAVDRIGTATTMVPAHRPIGTFGSLYVALPHHFVGGALSFMRGRDTSTWFELSPWSLPRYSYAACYRHTRVISKAITTGCRVLLVYNLIYVDPRSHTRDYPISVDAAATRLSTLAAKDHEPDDSRLAYPIRTSTSLSFNALSGHERDLVHALVLSGDFDVALASVRPKLTFDGGVNLAGYIMMAVPETSHILGSIELHPSIGDLRFLQEGLAGSLFHDYVSTARQVDHKADDNDLLGVLVFWPKQRRLEAAGPHGALLCLEDAVSRTDPLVGHESLNALVRRVLPLLATPDLSEAAVHQRIQTAANASATECFARLARILDVIGDPTLMATYMATSLDVVSFDTKPPAIATWIHRVCSTHGWEALSHGLEQLVGRWTNERATMAPAVRLIAALAGVDGPDPLCSSLRQPYLAELIKLLWRTAQRNVQELYYTVEAAELINVLGACLAVEGYVASLGEQPTAHWLQARLPPFALSAIDAALNPATSMTAIMLDDPDKCSLLNVVTQALAQSLDANPTLCVPDLATAVLQLLDDNADGINSLVVDVWETRSAIKMAADMVVIASRHGRLAPALRDRCESIFGSLLVPAICHVLRHTSLDADVQGMLLQRVPPPESDEMLRTQAKHLDVFYNMHPHKEVPPPDGAKNVHWRWIVDLLEAVTLVDSSKTLSYVHAWVANVLSPEPALFGDVAFYCLTRHAFWPHDAWMAVATAAIPALQAEFKTWSYQFRSVRDANHELVPCDCVLARQVNDFISTKYGVQEEVYGPRCIAVDTFFDDDDEPETLFRKKKPMTTMTLTRRLDAFTLMEAKFQTASMRIERLQAVMDARTKRRSGAKRPSVQGQEGTKRVCVPASASGALMDEYDCRSI
ncbi:hypothetical protein SDRG_04513 [Saprolegnia diclina VS20]|uniref:Uncharacterized protein n=1 Tax=Saprolegnia diclina (strain VS20) TaxID=1156394 RepID=T0RZV8_SAPDV|nr:hypothetical protein SDRG_04513 [Saprolegnia diclina VS20]EQC38083.1 hypothetical protein SDRG_04513 [Saprolegnia diclina VS20]|eukprot:XP_008608410.1 hypothetical protein SDRG_04513 [Saprolegnia diclina VS20]